MQALAEFAQTVVVVSIIGFTLAVGYQLLTGQIRTKGVLLDKGDRQISPGRIQLLMLTGIALITSLGNGSQAAMSNESTLSILPPELVLLLAGSHGIYLAGKFMSMRSPRTAENKE